MNNIIVPFVYADVSLGGKRSYVHYKAINPNTGKMERVRIYLDHIKNKRNRERMARKLVDVINSKLDTGWNPFVDEKDSRQFTPIADAIDFAKRIKFKTIRPASKQYYTVITGALEKWLKATNRYKSLIHEFNDDWAQTFANWLLVDRNMEPVNYNNHILVCRVFFTTLVKNKYIVRNPFDGIDKLKEAKKIKQAFTDEQLTAYVNEVKTVCIGLYVASMFCYCGAIRPKEISMLTKNLLNFDKGILVIPAHISKNGKDDYVQLPEYFIKFLREYLAGVPDNYLMVSADDFAPGTKRMAVYNFSKRFRTIANRLNLPDTLQFYSLKDTAADKLIQAGYDAKAIKNHFRHSSLAITDKYMQSRPVKVDEHIRKDYPAFE